METVDANGKGIKSAAGPGGGPAWLGSKASVPFLQSGAAQLSGGKVSGSVAFIESVV